MGPRPAAFWQAVADRGRRGPWLCFSLSGHLGRFYLGPQTSLCHGYCCSGTQRAFVSPMASGRPLLSWLTFHSLQNVCSPPPRSLPNLPTHWGPSIPTPWGSGLSNWHRLCPFSLLPSQEDCGIYKSKRQFAKERMPRGLGQRCKWTQDTIHELTSVVEASVQWTNLIPSGGSSLLGPFRAMCPLLWCHRGIS